MKTLGGIILFTAVEVVVLVAWGAVLDLGKGLPFWKQVVAVVILTVGLFVEHLLATNVGRGRPRLEIKD